MIGIFESLTKAAVAVVTVPVAVVADVVTLFDGKRRIVIDSGGLGDFHLHGYNVTVLVGD